MKKFMTKGMLMVLFALLTFGMAAVQAAPGSGPTRYTNLTVADSTATNSYVPIYGLYMDDPQKSQTIYPADLLTSMVGETIASLKYYASSATNSWTSTVTVSMGVTELANLSEGWSTDELTPVYTGTLSVEESVMELFFETPFTYEGGNLIVMFDSPEDGNNYTSCSFKGMSSFTGASRTIYGTNYASGPGTVRDFIPKTTFSYGEPPTCPKPLALTSTDVTAYTATLGWTEAGTAATWTIQYGEIGFTLGEGTELTVTENPFTLTELSPATTYQFYVKAVCGEGDESEWSNPSAFTTECATFTMPFAENFESTTYPPNCWEKLSGIAFDTIAPITTTSGWYRVATNNGIEGPHVKVNIYGTSCKYWLVTPPIAIEPNSALLFDMAFTDYGNGNPIESMSDDDKFMVMVSTDNGATWLEENATIWDAAALALVSNTATPVVINLAQYSGEIKIAFYAESTVSGGDNDFHIGNIQITEAPSCFAPYALTATPSNYSAIFNWTNGGEETAWNIAYDTMPIVDFSTATIVEVTEPSFTLTGLTPSTTYYAYIQAVCDEGNVSSWSNVAMFTTLVACPVPTNIVIVPSTTSAELSWTPGSTETSWNLEWGFLGFEQGTGTLGNITDNPYTLSDLTPTTAYSFYLQAVCDETEASEWMGPFNFNTLVECPEGTTSLSGTIGDGTTGTYTTPMNTFFNHSYTQQIFTAEELEAQGLTSGSINTFAFQYTNATPITKDNITIYMANTDQDVFVTQGWIPVTSLEEVYAGSLTMDNTGTDYWFEVQLQTPFEYDGVSNLVVAVLNNHGSYEGTQQRFLTHATTDNKSIRGQVDATAITFDENGMPQTTTALSGTATASRNNMRFDMCAAPIACQRPTGLAATNMPEATAVLLTWNGPENATGYNVFFNGMDVTSFVSGYIQGTTMTIPYFLLQMMPADEYCVVLQTVCSETETSAMSTPLCIPNPIPPACPTPTLNGELMDSTILLSWNTVEGATLYTIYYGNFALTTTTDTAIAITGAHPGETWCLTLTATCEAGEGNPSNEVCLTIPTPCGVISTLPYNEGFEGTYPTNCWTMVYGDGSGTINPMNHVTTPVYEGAQSYRFSSYTSTSDYNQYLISPEISFAEEMTVSFWYSTYGYGSEDFVVGYSSTTNDVASFTWSETVTANTTEWTNYSMSIPAGTKYVAINYFSQYSYYLYVDAFQITEGGMPTPCLPPTNTLATVDGTSITVTWEAPEGSAEVTGYGIFPVSGGAPVFVGADIFTYTFTDLAAGQHCYIVFTQCGTEEVDGIEACGTVEGPVSCPAPTNLTATANGTNMNLTWTAPADRDVLLFDDFETVTTEGIPEGWTSIDNDGDGNEWYGLNNAGSPVIQGHSGVGLMTSASYISAPLTPDNFLVTPMVEGATSVNYWVGAQDGAYAYEHYAICASSTGNAVADFAVIFEETMTAKGERYEGERGTRAQGAWYERTVDLPAGTKYVAFRHYNCTDAFRLNLDDVTINSGSAPSSYSYKVYSGVTEIATVNTTSFVDENLAPGHYCYTVKTVCESGMSEASNEACGDIQTSDCQAPTGLVAELASNETSVELSWTAPAERGVMLFEDFETGVIPSGWSMIDADGDGFNWTMGSAPGVSGNNESQHCMYSESYSAAGVPLTPDNWFVTPMVEGAGSINYYVCGQDAAYVAEHYGIFASSTGTNTADFSLVFEETMTAKRLRNEGAKGTNVQGTWYERNVDLPAGTKYIAFRHFNCTDMFYLDIDDITVYGEGSINFYNVYRDGVVIAQNVAATTYTDANLAPGEYCYTVKTVCESGLSNASNEACETVPEPASCPTPTDLTATATLEGINLAWAYAGGSPLSWSGIYDGNGIGTGSAAEFSCAQRWTAADLAGYNGKSITSIAFAANQETATFTVKIWVGGSQTSGPAEEVYSQEVASFNVGEETIIELTTPYIIDATQDLWVGYHCVATTGHPAGVDAGPAIDGKGNMMYFNNSWTTLLALGATLNFNWTIQANVEDNTTFNIYRDGTEIASDIAVLTYSDNDIEAGNYCYTVTANCGTEESEMSEEACAEYAGPCNPTTLEAQEVDGNIELTWTPVTGAVNYKVYYGTTLIKTTTETTHTVSNPSVGHHCFTVVTICAAGSSEPSNEACADISSINELSSNYNVYPNPANDKVTVEGENIESIAIYNVLGQRVENIKVEGSASQSISTTAYESGVYMLRITTTDGSIATKRVVIAH